MCAGPPALREIGEGGSIARLVRTLGVRRQNACHSFQSLSVRFTSLQFGDASLTANKTESRGKLSLASAPQELIGVYCSPLFIFA